MIVNKWTRTFFDGFGATTEYFKTEIDNVNEPWNLRETMNEKLVNAPTINGFAITEKLSKV